MTAGNGNQVQREQRVELHVTDAGSSDGACVSPVRSWLWWWKTWPVLVRLAE